MMKKMKNKKGFTLMEMLIVVAIIAILVVIAIPTFNAAMAKSRAATDAANIRSGYAAAQVEAMTENITSETTYYLQNDGTVTDATADRNDYTCKGDSSKVPDEASIGGKFTINNEVDWGKDGVISYTVTVGDDGVATVTGISSSVKSSANKG